MAQLGARRISGVLAHAIGTLALCGAGVLAQGCYDGIGDHGDAWEEVDDVELDVEPSQPGAPTSNATCGPTMHIFPVSGAHNIGHENECEQTGHGCNVSCPDQRANSDWNGPGGHNGIDIFAHEGAVLVAVADGQVVVDGQPSNTSGNVVKIKDACGWSYYYGHLKSATVKKNDWVKAGDVIGYMGRTGAASTHLHFNASPGKYTDDINPINLLKQTSPTACGGAPEIPPDDGGDDGAEPPPPPPPAEPPPLPPAGTCGVMLPGTVLYADQPLTSCDGRFSVLLQTDGNVVLYQAGSNVALWNSQTAGQPGNALVMQEDGNLVLYAADGTALWHTVTHGHPGSYLEMQSAGALIVFNGATPIWWSGTGGL